MIKFEFNPDKIDELLLEGLNYSYKGWGTQEHYDWVFRCKIDGLKPDILVGWEDGMIVYGTGIFYRTVRLWNGKKIKVAIIGSGFTFPGYRGKGFSTQAIKRSIVKAGEKKVALLTGFVVLNNPSYRNMIANQGEFFPTNYFRIDKNNGSIFEKKSSNLNVEDETLIETIMDIENRKRIGKTSFIYSKDEFRHQYCHRPSDIQFLSYKDGKGYVILEKKDDQNKILMLHLDDKNDIKNCIEELIGLSSIEGKGLFHFTTVPDEIDVCRQLGFMEISGVLPTFISNEEELKKALGYEGFINGSIYNKDCSRYIGEWDIRNGDRM
jgi:hypothetical protein